MEEQVREMKAGRILPKERAVQLQRKHGQRMPVPRRRRSKGAHDGAQRQADLDIRVRGDVQVVIEINESILPYRVINAEREQDKEQADQWCVVAGRWWVVSRGW